MCCRYDTALRPRKSDSKGGRKSRWALYGLTRVWPELLEEKEYMHMQIVLNLNVEHLTIAAMFLLSRR